MIIDVISFQHIVIKVNVMINVSSKSHAFDYLSRVTI